MIARKPPSSLNRLPEDARYRADRGAESQSRSRFHIGTNVSFWPEGNVLIPRRVDPISGEPDYNAFVRIERVG